ncbi:MAG TPA: hypothetical protein VMZ28_01780 [Kofleriaceae bacterium]|nr:hypothetical protein [Kofleriaceae bacterium]
MTAPRGAVLGAAAVLCGACSGAAGPVEPAAGERPLPGRIVTTERGPRGGRLVWVAEDGLTRGDLTPIESEPTLDTNPGWSPDGRWIVFASTRGRRGLAETSLWVVPANGGAPPVRLTRSSSVDRDPRFLPDGRAIVYASNDGKSFDLWLQPLAGGDGTTPPRATGKPRQLTRTFELDELSPSPRPDGKGVVYMAMDRSQKASLWSVALDGETQRLTDGPFDATPAVSPDGRRIVFAAPVKGRVDIDLHVCDIDGSNRRLLVADRIADETGPVWSADGRHVVATSVVRSIKTSKALMSLLVVIDMAEPKPILRGLIDLIDPASVPPRLGAALAPGPLDAAMVARNPTLKRVVELVLQNVLQQQGGGPKP